jgi:hypothetical protein
MRNVLDKSCRENQKTYFMFNTFFPKIVPFHEIMSKNVVEPERSQMAISRCVTCCLSKARRAKTHDRTHTSTHREICKTAFPHQQWFRKRTSTLRYTYIACLLKIEFFPVNIIYSQTPTQRHPHFTPTKVDEHKFLTVHYFDSPPS